MRRFANLIFALSLLSLVTACTEKPAVVTQKPIDVVVAKLESKTIPIYGDYIGRTEASLNVEVRARVSGFLEEQHFIEGSYVKKGQLLYTLDARPYEVALVSAQAAYKQAKNALAKAERDIVRLKPLFKADAASQLDVDNADAKRDSAIAGLKSAEAKLDGAKLDVEYSKLKAPINGLISASMVDVGALVGESGTSLLASIQQSNPMFVEFQMTTLDYLNARRRMKDYEEKRQADEEGASVEGLVSITLPDGTAYPYQAQIEFTEPKVNPETGTFKVRAKVPNADRELLPGQYTKTRIVLEQKPDTLLLPEEAVRFEQSGSLVFVILPDNTAESRSVILGRNVDGMFMVESGLSDGETVVIGGVHKIHHGSLVNALSPKQAKELSLKKPD